MRLLSALTLCAIGLCATTAEAQTPSFSKLITEFGGRTMSNYSTLPINAEECTTNPITIDLQFTNLPTSMAVLTVWRGTNCYAEASRIGTSKQCNVVTDMEITSSGAGTMSITMEELGCAGDDDIDETVSLYFLPMMSENAGGDVTDYDVLTIKIDTKRPSPPTNVRGGSGENAIPVMWTSDGADIKEFIVYYDANDTDCTSELLVAGQLVEPDGLGAVSASQGSASATVRGAVGVGERAKVGVVAVDNAGNESVLSTTACITGVPTVSWLDLHKAQGGKTGNTCSVASMNTERMSMLVLWLSVIALFAVRARRRNS